jgi:iron-sulfur cluster insertion protein
MSTTENNQASPIKISSSAANKVKQLLANSDKYSKDGFLRIYVTGGGCSGFQYGFMLDNNIAEDDTSISYQDANFMIDSLSYQYLYGAEVDYTEGLYGSKFVVTNPKAKATCGCGSSFSL